MTVTVYSGSQTFSATNYGHRATERPLHFQCTTEAELPTGNLQNGDTANSEDTCKRWRRDDGAWVADTVLDVIAVGLQETSGPTGLALGAIADGEYLKRVGNTLVGASVAGGGDMLKSENLSGLANYTTARSNLGLGTAATTAAADYATAAQGALAATALQSIVAGSITLAMQANMASASVVYRKTGGSGVPEINTLATLKTDLALVKGDVGLGSADNTTDAGKPVSTAQQTALNLKANLAGPTFTGTVGGVTAAMVGAPSGSGTSSGTNTGDQTITLTGDVTGTGTGSFATAIGAGKVTDAMKVETSAATSATTGTMTVNMTTELITITPTGACTFNASGGRVGRIITFSITTSGVSSFVLTFGTNFRKVGTLATGTVSARFFAVTFRCLSGGTIWQEISRTAVQT